MPAISLCRQLRERHLQQMRATETEAQNAAQSGDRARQSIASTESERHRQTAFALGLILDEASKDFLSNTSPDPTGSELPSWEELCSYWKERAETAENQLRAKPEAQALAPKPKVEERV